MVVIGERSHLAGRRSDPRITALEHVANRPIMHHVLDGLSEVSTDGWIVVGEAEILDEVEVSLRHYAHPLGCVDYVASGASSNIGTVLSQVAPLVGEAACILHPADGLLGSSAAIFASLYRGNGLDLVLLVPAPSDCDALETWDRLERGIPLAGSNDPRTAEVAVLGPGTLASAVRSGILDRGSHSLANLGRSLAASGASVETKRVDDWYQYSGEARELLELNRITLDRIVSDVPPGIRRSNRIEGQVRIDGGATVRSSVVVGPSVIGAAAIISDSYIGPYTAIGTGVRIEGSEIERSIVSPGADVLHVGARLVSSLVGRDTRVVRDFTLPRALRLWVGDGDEIALC